MREELAVGLAVVVPVDPMEVDVIELLLDLLPCVVEDILTLSCGTMLKLSSEADRLEMTTIELIQPRGCTNIDGLPVRLPPPTRALRSFVDCSSRSRSQRS